jgi:hypothetical protein
MRKRPRMALPMGVNLRDYAFEPTRDEKLWDRLRQIEREWIKEDDQRRRERANQIAAEVEQARIQQQQDDEVAVLQAEIDAVIDKRRAYYLERRKAEGPVTEKLIAKYESELNIWQKKAQAKLDQLTKDIQRDKIKAERETLAARGVIRGRRRG